MAQIQSSDPVWTSLRRAPDDSRPPAALVLGIAFAVLLGWVGTASVLGLPTSVAVLGAGVVVVVASWWLTAPAALLAAGIGFLVVDGFVLDQLGTLSWNGSPDAVLLIMLVLGGTCAAEARREVDVARDRGHAVNKP